MHLQSVKIKGDGRAIVGVWNGTSTEYFTYPQSGMIDLAKLSVFAAGIGKMSTANIVCDGNSITANGGWAEEVKTFAPFSGAGCNIANFGVGAQSTQQMAADAAAQIDPLISPTRLNILIAWELGNEIYYGASPVAAYAVFKAYCLARRAAGWKVICVVPPPRRHYALTSAGDDDAQYKIKHDAGRLLLRQGWATFADAAIDAESVPALSDCNDRIAFPDGVHPTQFALKGFAQSAITALYNLAARL